MFEFIDKGGPFVWVLLALAFVGTILVFERIIFFQRTKIHVGDLILGLSNHIRKGAHDEAMREASRAPGSVARVAHATLMRHYLPRADLRDVSREAGQLEVPRIEKNLRGLYAIALIAPLIGMMGTINGLIHAFKIVSDGSGPGDTSRAIYECLVTTGLGLVVAVPGYLFYLYFLGRAKRLVHRIERAAIEVVNLICDQREAPKKEVKKETTTAKEDKPISPSTERTSAKKETKNPSKKTAKKAAAKKK